MADFHFSPRANRAAEIAWMPWAHDAFARAEAESKPILLGISAVWCHWCHVMDETSYSDPGIIERINRNFVAVRVDNDERPDVNARYNMGGWPTTAFLAPDGSIITGFTYMPPSQMQRALDEIAGFYSENRGDIAQRAAQMLATHAASETPPIGELRAEIVEDVAHKIAGGYDSEYGGFGDAPKFPQPEVLEFLLHRFRAGGDPLYLEIVAHTMRAMSNGGMYDRVEGGFFRYSTTRDWSVPHFEKMAEDHAGLVRVLAQLQLWAPDPAWRATLESTIYYLRTSFLDPASALFAGSQDADEAYFSLDAPSRRGRETPYIDRRSYSNWTSGLAAAFAWASTALSDRTLATQALATLDSLHERMRDPDGLLYHVFEPGALARVRGLLTDQVSYIRALLDAYEHTGEPRAIERALAHVDLTISRFETASGGFTDHARVEAPIGRLDLADRPIMENGLMAEALLRLATLTGDSKYSECARRALEVYAQTYRAAGQFAATYARALDRYLAPEVSVKVCGPEPGAGALREAAMRLPAPYFAIATGEGAEPAAYVCVGTVCAAPVGTPAQIAPAYDRVINLEKHSGP